MTIEERLEILEAVVRVLAIEDYVDDSTVCLRHNGKAEAAVRCRLCQETAYKEKDIDHDGDCAAQGVFLQKGGLLQEIDGRMSWADIVRRTNRKGQGSATPLRLSDKVRRQTEKAVAAVRQSEKTNDNS